MILELWNSAFERIIILDDYTSMIWTDRYWEAGDFEIRIPPSDTLLTALGALTYLYLRESDHLMVFEDYELKTDVEEGDVVSLSGTSLEYNILRRRIVWEQTALTGNLQDAIESLLDDSFISPTDTDRTVSNFEFVASTDPVITALTVNTQFFGEFVYDAISDMCKAEGIGFKITLTPALNFRFELYAGVDRSYAQSTESYIVFSNDYENLITAVYSNATRWTKTAVLIGGEKGIGNVRTTAVVQANTPADTGLARREVYIEPSVQRSIDGVQMSDADYILQLEGRGTDELAKRTQIESFEGQLDGEVFVYRTDYDMGDVVQVKDSYENQTESRVTEMIFSRDEEGTKIFPTFSKLNN